ncbi:MLC1 [Symbiodinium natans]|uniref:MLC1 protein n=1 Tax=Symbiodinium natans TaxID=878477 RepID=A0A812TQE7_9DINO|nr:MLC1 [Symbiodinium natans]
MAGGAPKDRLYEVLAQHRYLDSGHHALNEYVRQIREANDDPSAGDPNDLLDRLEQEVKAEEETLARAFNLFDSKRKGELEKGDLKSMNRYLGFPSDDADIQRLLKMIDTDGSGKISFTEFQEYVGKMGGSGKLFEERQKRIKQKLGYDLRESADTEAISAQLTSAGIDREAQAYWKMVVQPSEFQEAARMQQCQQKAVKHIRALAKKNHQEALPELQKRVASLRFQEEDLWLTLAWIRELAPVIIHVNLDKMLQFMEKDTHYRNQFETNTSGGLLKPATREKWERDLFGGSYDGSAGKDRPKYGVQNVMNDHRGVVRCAQYGDSYLILKDVRLRCTFSPEDSANLRADKLAVLDFYAHVLLQYDIAELSETIKVATSKDAALLGDSDKVGKMKYKEAQIHGEIDLRKHVERLVAHTRHRGTSEGSRIQTMCKQKGFGFSWMDEEQERMRKEKIGELGGAAWQKRLQQLQEDGGELEVPEGYCRVGCGRQVAPGVTRAGRPFTTCCRGCIMGFGHDLRCGNIDASKVGPGKCKNGCGLNVAPGCDSKGRPLTTCCKGCALGMAHDRFCQKAAPSGSSRGYKPEPGMCKIGCGRKVAPGTTRSGNPYDTCCRDCSTSGGATHSSSCAK